MSTNTEEVEEDTEGSNEISEDPVSSLNALSVTELFSVLNTSEGEVVLDFGLDPNFSSRVFLRVYNDNAQLIKVTESGTDSDEVQLSSDEVSTERFKKIVEKSSKIVIRPRSQSPFSRKVQGQLRDKNKQ